MDASFDFNYREKPPSFADTVNACIDTVLVAEQAERPARDYLGGSRFARSASDKAVTILRTCDAGELLPRHTIDSDHFECRFFAWRERCWA